MAQSTCKYTYIHAYIHTYLESNSQGWHGCCWSHRTPCMASAAPRGVCVPVCMYVYVCPRSPVWQAQPGSHVCVCTCLCVCINHFIVVCVCVYIYTYIYIYIYTHTRILANLRTARIGDNCCMYVWVCVSTFPSLARAECARMTYVLYILCNCVGTCSLLCIYT